MASHAAGTGCRFALTFPEDNVQVWARSLDGRSQSKQNRGEKGNAECKHEDSGIDCDFGGVWNFSGERDEQLDPAKGQADAQQPSAKGEDRDHREKLREIRAESVLFAARLGTELQEVGDVHARNQEDEGHGTKQGIDHWSSKTVKV